jgi:hypothetical protein
MQIINESTYRLVTNLNDTFLRFISKEGINEYPTVIFLANRLFLSDDKKIAPQFNITSKITSGNDFFWYKDKSPEEIINSLITKIDEIVKDCLFFTEDAVEEHTKIIKLFHSVNGYYIKKADNKLYFTSKMFSPGIEILLPGDDTEIVDVITINETADLIVTLHGAYNYHINDNILVKRFSKSNTITAVCKAGAYAVITYTERFAVIKNLNSNDDWFSYSEGYQVSSSQTDPDGFTTVTNNGLPERFDYCAPERPDSTYVKLGCRGGAIITINCANFNNNAPNGNNSEIGYSSRNWGNTGVIFGHKNSDIDSNSGAFCNGQFYPAPGVHLFSLHNNSLICAGPEGIAGYILGSVNGVVLNNSNALPQSITACYNDENAVYIFTSDGKTFISKDTDNLNTAYALDFNYSRDRQTEKLETIKKVPFSLASLLTIPANPAVLNKINGSDVSFLFLVLKTANGSFKWCAFGDDNRREVEFINMANAFDIG